MDPTTFGTSTATVILRRNPQTRWWHWICTDCRQWSRWHSFAHAVDHADTHARRDCAKEVVPDYPGEAPC